MTMPENPDYDADSDDFTELVTGDDPNALQPVPVKVANVIRVETHPARSWTAQQIPVNALAPVHLAPENPARLTLRVKNNGTDTVYLAAQQETCTDTSGYPLAANEFVDLVHTANVYAVCATGDTSLVGVLGQYHDGQP